MAPEDLGGYTRFIRHSERIFRIGSEQLACVPFDSLGGYDTSALNSRRSALYDAASRRAMPPSRRQAAAPLLHTRSGPSPDDFVAGGPRLVGAASGAQALLLSEAGPLGRFASQCARQARAIATEGSSRRSAPRST